ncbi:MAG: flagellar hook assembly protein FlgD [Acidobacteriota bacterium]
MQIADIPVDLSGLVGESTTPAFTPSLGRDDFLKLLVTKLANQDPLTPAQDTEFISQLAQFSQLEQAIKSNENLADLSAGQSSLINAQALSLIGRDVVVDTQGAMRLDGARADPMLVRVPEGTVTAGISIFDPSGLPVRTVALSDLKPGQQTFVWDGADDAGHTLPDGDYTFDVTAQDAAGENLDVESFMVLGIEGVNFRGGLPILVSGSQEVPFEGIVEIRDAGSFPAPPPGI